MAILFAHTHILCTCAVYKGLFSTSWWWYSKWLVEPSNILRPHEVTQHVFDSPDRAMVPHCCWEFPFVNTARCRCGVRQTKRSMREKESTLIQTSLEVSWHMSWNAWQIVEDHRMTIHRKIMKHPFQSDWFWKPWRSMGSSVNLGTLRWTTAKIQGIPGKRFDVMNAVLQFGPWPSNDDFSLAMIESCMVHHYPTLKWNDAFFMMKIDEPDQLISSYFFHLRSVAWEAQGCFTWRT